MSPPTRSPLKDKPLRLPGQSLEEERRRLIESQFESPALVAVMFGCMAGLEWVRAYWPQPPTPWLYTAVAAAACTLAGWRLWRLRPRLQQLRQGIDGERAVGQFLERLREQGYQVFHDVPGTGFNIDHVCIGPGGAFTIETKTWSKPVKGDARVLHDGERLTIAGITPERDPLQQARAQAHWLTRLIEDSAGRRIPTQPVVVFPGWFVEAAPGAQRAVWVMEPKGLPAFLANEPNRLTPEDVKLCALHLSRYVRSTQAAESPS